jgi:hypothetical protein
MTLLQIVLSLEETNQVLSALGEQPYSKVHALIEKIRAQAVPQLQAHEQPLENESSAAMNESKLHPNR